MVSHQVLYFQGAIQFLTFAHHFSSLLLIIFTMLSLSLAYYRRLGLKKDGLINGHSMLETFKHGRRFFTRRLIKKLRRSDGYISLMSDTVVLIIADSDWFPFHDVPPCFLVKRVHDVDVSVWYV